MPIVFRWLVRVAAGLLLLGVLAVIGVYYLASRSLPRYDDTIQVTDLSAPIEIVRDNANIPHIDGQTDTDVFYGLGFAHAQDRLWQMTLLRRTAQGRLSEVFGTDTLKTDEFLRRMDIYTLAAQSFEAQDAYTKAALTAYAAGVNARLTQINDQALGRGAPEFFIFPTAIAPWQPADSLAVLKLLSVQLAAHMEEEILRARVALQVGAEHLDDIMPDDPGKGLAAPEDFSALFPTLRQTAPYTTARATLHALDPRARRDLGGASNAWAAAPDRSANGGSLLANDPHLGFTAPAIWYLANLDLQDGPIIGATIPGIPGILSGRSDDLAWGITSSYLDDQDLYVEQLNPDNPEEYLTPEGFRPFVTRRSIINVKDGAPLTLALRWTENGPVLSRSDPDIAAITPQGHVMSMAWTALTADDPTMTGVLQLNRAKSIAAALRASELFVSPAENVVLADKTGVAMKTVGAMPRRDERHQSQGRHPTPGWLAENRWQGTLPFSANPGFVSPPGGIVGNTNNKILERPFPLHVSFKWGDTQRYKRWQKLMQIRDVHTRDSFVEAQLDTVSHTARALLPLIGADLWYTGEPAAAGTIEAKRQTALRLLSEWNGEMNEHLPEPLIYMAWLRALQDRLIRDDLGPLTPDFLRPDPLFIERVFRNIDGAQTWCDIKQSADVETCPQIARQALDTAILWLEDTYGTNLSGLRWGEAHQATHDHPVLGKVPVLNWFVNIRQRTSGGDNTLMRGMTKGSGPQPFLNSHGSGYRGVYDLADPDGSVFVISTGQSGHFLSRFYDDLGELWRRGEYVPMSLDLDLARAAAVGVTNLVPATP